MLKIFSKYLAVLLLFSFAGRVYGTAKPCGLPLPQFYADNRVLTVTQLTPSTAYMSWTPFGTSGEYAVTVTDLTTFSVLTSFNTSNTTATISGISGGHSYRFVVATEKESDIIIVIEGG